MLRTRLRALSPAQANFDGRYPFPPDNYDEAGVYPGRPCEVAHRDVSGLLSQAQDSR